MENQRARLENEMLAEQRQSTAPGDAHLSAEAVQRERRGHRWGQRMRWMFGGLAVHWMAWLAAIPIYAA